MTFLYPLGLLGLIGIPILIIIYIIKNKYTEQTVTSTYLWTLSEKFLKRRIPISKLAGLISLILQILIIAALSLAIAHPVIVMPGAAHEYCFIFDISGSMNVEENGETRFEKGVGKIEEVINDSLGGSYYTLICVDENTAVVFERETDKKLAIEELNRVTPGYASADITDAVDVAKGYFTNNAGIKTYLITDKTYQNTNNVEVINVGSQVDNHALSDVNYVLNGEKLTVNGKVISYSGDKTLTLELYLDEREQLTASKTVSASGEFTPFTFEETVTVSNVNSVTVKIKEEDALALDNQATVFNLKNENSYKTLLIGDSTFFLEAAIVTVSNAQITKMTSAEYEQNPNVSGYGLYVFDGVVPKTLPVDGTVWFLNVQGSVPGSGFSFQGVVDPEYAIKLEKSTSTSSLVQKLTYGVEGSNFIVSQYVKYGLYRNFTQLYTYNRNNAMVFTGTSERGNREVVFAFDLHNSNHTISIDYVALLKNLLDFSFPTVVEKVSYECGENLEVNVLANSDSVKIISPSQKETYLDTSSVIGEYTLDEVGAYQIVMTVGGAEKVYNVYSVLPEAERTPVQTAERVEIVGEASGSGLNGIYDIVIFLFALLAVVFIADWGVYCYDKYQLR